MADTPDDKTAQQLTTNVHLSIIDTWKLKLPSVYLALPPELIGHIGFITIAWGVFEKSLERLLFGVIATTGVTIKGNWQRFGLDQRCGLLRDEASVCFSANPDLFSRLSSVMDDVGPLQLQRNALVHGRLSLRISDNPAIVANYENKQQMVTLTLTKDQIDDLYYEILYLAGRMTQFAHPELTPFDPPLSSQDKSRLQDVLSNSPPPQSIPSMIAGLRKPSGA